MVTPRPFHPATPQAVAFPAWCEIIKHPGLENLFACEWDAATGTITAAAWLARGCTDKVRLSAVDLTHPFLRAGRGLLLHNHPNETGAALRPSPADSEIAALLAATRGLGMAIVSDDLADFLMIRLPGLPAAREWRLGPFTLTQARGAL